MKTRNLIELFIQGRVEDHPEPQRAGKTKGEKIGFPQSKYLAALLSGLTRRDLKVVCAECGVSYGLLRKWRTEPDFKELVKGEQRMFAEFLVEVFKSRFREGYRQATKQETIPYISSPDIDPRSLNPYVTLKIFEVIKEKVEAVAAHAKQNAWNPLHLMELLILDLAQVRLTGCALSRGGDSQEIVQEILLLAFETVIKLVSTGKEKKYALTLLRFLRDYLLIKDNPSEETAR